MPAIQREKKEMEYGDAPSGFVTLYNYKEPFMKYEKGFGFQGVLLFDGETDKVQCHLCGEWFISLPQHTAKEHNMSAAEYKEEVGLNKNTALISESMRAKLIANGLDKRLANLRLQGRKSAEARRKISEGLKRMHRTREAQNVKGTCPEQLIDFLQKEYRAKGDKMRFSNMRLDEVIIKTFGSMEQACVMAGIPYRKPGQTISNKNEITKDELINRFHKFFIENGQMPRYKDMKNEWAAIKRKNFNIDEIIKLASLKDGVYRKSPTIIKYNKDELLVFLRNFEKVNGRKPSYSDSKRGLLPVLSRYSYHFGSWRNALAEAFK